MSQVLIETDTLQEHLNDPSWVIVDCRFELADPTSGIEQYREGHIPGAFYADLNHDLSSKPTPTNGRHPLPDILAFRKLVQSWGVQPDSRVIAYDSEGGAMAAGRLWWLLRVCGHENASILNGGFPKWLLEDRPLEAEQPAHREPSTTEFAYHPELIFDAQAVERIRKNPEWLLVDSRAENRFYADQEVIDIIAGHIPGARHLAYGSILNPDGTYRSEEDLRSVYQPFLGRISPEQTVFYCGSGITSVVHLVAMEHAGLPGGRLYAGSWSDWIRDPKHEIAVK